jgi:hypothetical protein
LTRGVDVYAQELLQPVRAVPAVERVRVVILAARIEKPDTGLVRDLFEIRPATVAQAPQPIDLILASLDEQARMRRRCLCERLGEAPQVGQRRDGIVVVDPLSGRTERGQVAVAKESEVAGDGLPHKAVMITRCGAAVVGGSCRRCAGRGVSATHCARGG